MTITITIQCPHALSPVKTGDKLAGMKAVPLVIPEEKLREARKAAGQRLRFFNSSVKKESALWTLSRK
jgi:hypothetical protein